MQKINSNGGIMDGNELWDDGYKFFAICGMKIFDGTRVILIKQDVVVRYNDRWENINRNYDKNHLVWETIPMFVALNCNKKYPFGNPLFIKKLDILKLPIEDIQKKHLEGIEYYNSQIKESKYYRPQTHFTLYVSCAKEDVERFFSKKDYCIC